MVNFRYVPVAHQLLVVNLFCYFDDIFLSYVQHNGMPQIFSQFESWWFQFIGEEKIQNIQRAMNKKQLDIKKSKADQIPQLLQVHNHSSSSPSIIQPGTLSPSSHSISAPNSPSPPSNDGSSSSIPHSHVELITHIHHHSPSSPSKDDHPLQCSSSSISISSSPSSQSSLPLLNHSTVHCEN